MSKADFFMWRVYHPNISKLDMMPSSSPIKEPYQYLMTTVNGLGVEDGHLIAVFDATEPTLTDSWQKEGWKLESKGVASRVDFRVDSKSPEAEPEIIEVHNAWTVYGMDDSTIVEEPFATLSRPQDWGDPRWHYERFRLEWFNAKSNKHYIHHAHCWTDLVDPKTDYPRLFAPLICSICMPGSPEALCGRDFIDIEDFWCNDWGPMPPVFDESQDVPIDR